eukprot:gene543-935_t
MSEISKDQSSAQGRSDEVGRQGLLTAKEEKQQQREWNKRPFRVIYDDDDEEDGIFLEDGFRVKNGLRSVEWLDGEDNVVQSEEARPPETTVSAHARSARRDQSAEDLVQGEPGSGVTEPTPTPEGSQEPPLKRQKQILVPLPGPPAPKPGKPLANPLRKSVSVNDLSSKPKRKNNRTAAVATTKADPSPAENSRGGKPPQEAGGPAVKADSGPIADAPQVKVPQKAKDLEQQQSGPTVGAKLAQDSEELAESEDDDPEDSVSLVTLKRRRLAAQTEAPTRSPAGSRGVAVPKVVNSLASLPQQSSHENAAKAVHRERDVQQTEVGDLVADEVACEDAARGRENENVDKTGKTQISGRKRRPKAEVTPLSGEDSVNAGSTEDMPAAVPAQREHAVEKQDAGEPAPAAVEPVVAKTGRRRLRQKTSPEKDTEIDSGNRGRESADQDAAPSMNAVAAGTQAAEDEGRDLACRSAKPGPSKLTDSEASAVQTAEEEVKQVGEVAGGSAEPMQAGKAAGKKATNAKERSTGDLLGGSAKQTTTVPSEGKAAGEKAAGREGKLSGIPPGGSAKQNDAVPMDGSFAGKTTAVGELKQSPCEAEVAPGTTKSLASKRPVARAARALTDSPEHDALATAIVQPNTEAQPSLKRSMSPDPDVDLTQPSSQTKCALKHPQAAQTPSSSLAKTDAKLDLSASSAKLKARYANLAAEKASRSSVLLGTAGKASAIDSSAARTKRGITIDKDRARAEHKLLFSSSTKAEAGKGNSSSTKAEAGKGNSQPPPAAANSVVLNGSASKDTTPAAASVFHDVAGNAGVAKVSAEPKVGSQAAPRQESLAEKGAAGDNASGLKPKVTRVGQPSAKLIQAELSGGTEDRNGVGAAASNAMSTGEVPSETRPGAGKTRAPPPAGGTKESEALAAAGSKSVPKLAQELEEYLGGFRSRLFEGLSRNKEDVAKTREQAIEAARKFGARGAGKVMKVIAEGIEQESSTFKKLNIFYLVDSIITYVGHSKEQVVRDAFPTSVACLLERLVKAAVPKGSGGAENCRSVIKTLSIWETKKYLSKDMKDGKSMIKPVLTQLTAQLQHEKYPLSQRPTHDGWQENRFPVYTQPKAAQALDEPICLTASDLNGLDEYGTIDIRTFLYNGINLQEVRQALDVSEEEEAPAASPSKLVEEEEEDRRQSFATACKARALELVDQPASPPPFVSPLERLSGGPGGLERPRRTGMLNTPIPPPCTSLPQSPPVARLRASGAQFLWGATQL